MLQVRFVNEACAPLRGGAGRGLEARGEIGPKALPASNTTVRSEAVWTRWAIVQLSVVLWKDK